MWARAVLVLAALAVGDAAERRTLALRMVVVPGADRVVAGDGVSRFGPLLEYLVQAVQTALSRRPAGATAAGALLSPGPEPGVYRLQIPITLHDRGARTAPAT